jgi:hypothetical protein
MLSGTHDTLDVGPHVRAFARPMREARDRASPSPELEAVR